MLVERYKLLCCPLCGDSMSCDHFEIDVSGRVISGMLTCECGSWYPIINGIPRILIGPLRDSLQKEHEKYFYYFGGRLPGQLNTSKLENNLPNNIRTQRAFGYEWTQFDHYQADNFSSFMQPLGESFFEGKLGLDIGCGNGRHVNAATSYGAAVIGVDVSASVDVARRKNQDNERADFVQADLLRLPFIPQAFDFVYSLGVLHHLTDPEFAFRSLIPQLKVGGTVFIWVYQRTVRKILLEYVRSITTRVPFPISKLIAFGASVVDYGCVVNLYRVLPNSWRSSKWIPSRIKEYARYDFYTSYTDWFDRLSAPISHCYTESDIYAWLASAKLDNIEVLLIGDSWVWGKGTRK